jgi:hypothetical protein
MTRHGASSASSVSTPVKVAGETPKRRNRKRTRRATDARRIHGAARERQAAWNGREHNGKRKEPRDAREVTVELNGHARDITKEKGSDSPQTPELPAGLYVEHRREQREGVTR